MELSLISKKNYQLPISIFLVALISPKQPSKTKKKKIRMSNTTCSVLGSCKEFTTYLFLYVSLDLLSTFFVILVGGQKIQNIQPFCKKDLEIRNLADRIGDIAEISYLYPNISKFEAFGKYITGEALHVRHIMFKCLK